MKIRIKGFLYEIVSLQVLALGTSVSVQYIDPKVGVQHTVISTVQFSSVLAWGGTP